MNRISWDQMSYYGYGVYDTSKNVVALRVPLCTNILYKITGVFVMDDNNQWYSSEAPYAYELRAGLIIYCVCCPSATLTKGHTYLLSIMNPTKVDSEYDIV